MGILAEAVVKRLDGAHEYKAHSWLRDDGTFEAFWYEGGVRVCYAFDHDGKQLGMWRQYKLSLV